MQGLHLALYHIFFDDLIANFQVVGIVARSMAADGNAKAGAALIRACLAGLPEVTAPDMELWVQARFFVAGVLGE